MFEDPWKTFVMCWIVGRNFFLQPVEVMTVRQGQGTANKTTPNGPEESFRLDDWIVSTDAKDRKAQKFTLVNKDSGEKLSFRAPSDNEVEDKWIKEIQHALESEPYEAEAAQNGDVDDGATDGVGPTLQLDGYHNFFYGNGDKYEGEWASGKKHGSGRYIRADGTVYMGMYRNDVKHGQGNCKWPNGNEYDGSWADGLQHGQGRLVSSDGRTYQGQWASGRQHGNFRCRGAG